MTENYNNLTPEEFDGLIEEEFFYDGSPINGLLDILKSTNKKNRTYVINPPRYKEFVISFAKISEFILSSDKDAKINIDHNTEISPTSLGIRIETDTISGEVLKFIDAMKYGNIFEIHPRLDEKNSMSISFNDVYSIT